MGRVVVPVELASPLLIDSLLLLLYFAVVDVLLCTLLLDTRLPFLA